MESNKSKYFNFEKLKSKSNIWKGEINKVFHTSNLTIMSFKIKKGVKFDDKGHKSEQITILLKGKFKFYIGNETKIMEKNDAVFIASGDNHGGEALTDIEGFDVFYPKRDEKQYNDLN